MRRAPLVISVLLLFACASPGFRADLDAGVRALEGGDPAAAAEHWERALARPAVEPTSPAEQVWVRLELGELYFTWLELGAESRAHALFEDAWRLADQGLPPGDALRLRALERLGLYEAEHGEPAEARELLEQFMDEARARLDPVSLHETEASAALLDVYAKLGDDAAWQSLSKRRKHPLLLEEDAPIAEFEPFDLYLAPNVADVDGTGAFVHYTRADMPLRVSLGRPEVTTVDSTPQQTAQAAALGFRLWEQRLRGVVPWFRLDIVEDDPSAPIQVEWRRRGLYYLPAVGSIRHSTDGGTLSVRSRIVLSAKPIPLGEERLRRGELSIWAAHAFGAALGLVDCVSCESIMAVDWRRADAFEIRDLDVRTLESLLAKPNGERADGRRLLALQATEAVVAPVGAAPDGVLADLPIINDGRGINILIDLSDDERRPFPWLLDTGAADSIMTTPMARALGISVRSAKTDPYRRGTVTGRPLRFWVTGQRVVGRGRGPSHFQYALLGGTFLEQYVLDIDYASRRVRFLDPEHWVLGDERWRLPGEEVFELHMSGTHPYVDVEVGNGSVRALLDTGAMSPLSITEEKAAELGIAVDLDADRVHFRNVLGTSTDVVQRVASARVGDVELDGLDVYIAIRDESQVRVTRWLQGEAILGMATLQDYRVRLDYRRGRASLTPNARDAE